MKPIIIAALGLYVASVVLNLAMVFVLALPFWWLWNAVLPSLVSALGIGYWPAVGVLGLIAVLRWVISGARLAVNFRARQ